MSRAPFWFVRNIYAWVIFLMSVVTAIILGEFWVLLVGVIGYLFALIVELTRGQSLSKTGVIRLARAEQEYRELKAEQARLLGAIRERDEKLRAAGLLDAADEMPTSLPDPLGDETVEPDLGQDEVSPDEEA